MENYKRRSITEETEVTTVRLRRETRAWLQRRADANDRTLSAEVRRMLEQAHQQEATTSR